MEESNSWDCSVCTFKNSAEAFKCLMCDVRKGTSTRKPRINPEMVAKQVARQQEQIKQQALKTAVKSKSSDKISRKLDDTNSNSSIASTNSSGRNSPINGSICSSNSVESTSHAANSSFFDNLSTKINTAGSSKALNLPSSSRNSIKTNDSDEEVDENEEVEGQNVPAPPRNGKTGRKSKSHFPRAKLKNVDRTDVRVKEVTVNNITVVITEFKLKRKFSEVSENHTKQSSSDSSKKIKSELPAKSASPDKASSKDANVLLNRSKASSNDKKSAGKGANKGSIKVEEPVSNSKKRTVNSLQAESSEHSSSKKTATPLEGNA